MLAVVVVVAAATVTTFAAAQKECFQMNEEFVMCGHCEASCDNPHVTCLSECRGSRCECVQAKGFVRTKHGHCIQSSECPGPNVFSMDPFRQIRPNAKIVNEGDGGFLSDTAGRAPAQSASPTNEAAALSQSDFGGGISGPTGGISPDSGPTGGIEPASAPDFGGSNSELGNQDNGVQGSENSDLGFGSQGAGRLPHAEARIHEGVQGPAQGFGGAQVQHNRAQGRGRTQGQSPGFGPQSNRAHGFRGAQNFAAPAGGGGGYGAAPAPNYGSQNHGAQSNAVQPEGGSAYSVSPYRRRRVVRRRRLRVHRVLRTF